MNTNTKYLGLDVKSPIIAGSCGLMSNVDNMKRAEDAGAGAVIVKSIFEEQIIYDIKRNTHVFAPVDNYGDSYEYVAKHVADDYLERHFEMIKAAKSALEIPVVGSINCYSYENWVTYAKYFYEAGCDALELNMAILPYETSLSADDVERSYNDIIRTLNKVVPIPVSIKVAPYFTDMAKFLQQLSWMGVNGVTMFNKSLSIDVDVEQEKAVNADRLSAAEDLFHMLRWVAIMSKKMRCPISASTGVYEPQDVVKLLLCGAGTVQTVSALYKNGIGYIKGLNKGLTDWMERHGYECLDDFCGKLAVASNAEASMMYRTQFIRYFGEIE